VRVGGRAEIASFIKEANLFLDNIRYFNAFKVDKSGIGPSSKFLFNDLL